MAIWHPSLDLPYLDSGLNVNRYNIAPPCPDLHLIRCQTAKGRLKTYSGFSDGLFHQIFLAVRRHIVAVDEFVFVGVA